MIATRPSSLVALFISTTFLTSQIFAGTQPTVAVPPLGDSSSHQRASQAVAQSLKSSGRVSVVDTPAILRYLQSQRKTGPAPKANEDASKALSRGQNAYKQLRLKEAATELTKAKLLYREALLDEDSFQALRAAQFHLAMTFLASKDEARAKEELREVVLLDPERNIRELSTRLYPPTVRNLYKTVVLETAKKDQGELEISSTPPGATVQIDGKSLGSTPVKVNRLPTGQHYVRIQKEGTDGFFGPKFIVAGENRMEVELKAAVSSNVFKNFGTVNASSEIEPKRAAFLEDMGLAVGSDIIVFLSPDVAKVKGQLYDQRSQEISNVEIDSTPEGLAAKLLRSLDKDGYVTKIEKKSSAEALPSRQLPKNLQPDAEGTFTQAAKAPDEPPAEHGPSIFSKPWFWGIVGGVLLVGGAAVVLSTTDIAKKKATTSTLTVTIP